MAYIQKYAPSNCITSSLYKTYNGTASDRFTVKQDSEPYCVEISLAGQTAYTVGGYPNDRRDMPYWFTKEKIIAPYPATIGSFSKSIEEGKWWRIDLANDTIPDYNQNNVGSDSLVLKSSYPTSTGSLCYSRMDANNGADGYNSRAAQPISATNWLNDSSYSFSPTLTIERLYSRSRFYRLKVYKNGVLIDTIVTIGCRDKNDLVGRGHTIKPLFVFEGFVTNQCPLDTCSVDCGTYVCCYNSQGISVFNYTK